MITITNISEGTIELVTEYEPSTPGFRLTGNPPDSQLIEPGEAVQFLGYEPGVRFILRPVVSPEVPRAPTYPWDGGMSS